MPTTSTLINNVTVGSAASPASNITKWTLAATSVAVSLEAKFTPGAVSDNTTLRVWWARSADSRTANAATVDALKQVANALIWNKMLPGGVEHYSSSDLEGVKGGYVYLWVEEPLLSAVGTLTVKGTEM